MIGHVEGTGFETLDPRFKACFVGHEKVERLWTGGRWLEGPAWFAPGRYLVFSDIPNNRMLRHDDTNGAVSVFRQPSNNANGNTVDNQGRLVTCEHLTRRVTRTDFDGSISVLADSFDGRRLNSPNDVVVKSDGTVWFTDPPYGILSDYEGDYAEQEVGGCHVYRHDPATGETIAVATDFDKPNGLAFSPDESELYVADSACAHEPEKPRHIRAFTVGSNNSLKGGKPRFILDQGFPDGFRVDTDGNVWTSAGAGINVYAADGTALGRINFPQIVSNLTFGGPKRNRLFVTCTHELYSVYVTATGAQRP